MKFMHRTSLGLAAFVTAVAAHAAPLNTGSYVFGSQLSSPGSFDAMVASASAGTATLAFQLAGFLSLDGANNGYSDFFHLSVNGTEVFAGSFNLGGGGSNAIQFNPNGATAVTTTYGATDDPQNSTQVTWAGGVTDISLSIALLGGNNTITFAYTGGAQGLGDEAWGLNSGSVTAAVPEPETYALMLAGLCAIGMFARRRKSA